MKFYHKEVVTMMMWKKVNMPEKIRNTVSGVFEKTGKDTEMTGYYFHDIMGEEIYFVSPKNEFRELLHKSVNVELNVVFDDYSRKNKLSLSNVTEAKLPEKKA